MQVAVASDSGLPAFTVAWKPVVYDVGLTAVTALPLVVATFHEYVTVPVWLAGVHVEDEEVPATPAVLRDPERDNGETEAENGLVFTAPLSCDKLTGSAVGTPAF